MPSNPENVVLHSHRFTPQRLLPYPRHLLFHLIAWPNILRLFSSQHLPQLPIVHSSPFLPRHLLHHRDPLRHHLHSNLPLQILPHLRAHHSPLPSAHRPHRQLFLLPSYLPLHRHHRFFQPSMLLQPLFDLPCFHSLPSHHHPPVFPPSPLHSPVSPDPPSMSRPVQPPSSFSSHIQLSHYSRWHWLLPLIQQIHPASHRHFLHPHSPSSLHHLLQSPHHLPPSYFT